MARTINIELSASSVQKAAEQINQYRHDLTRKCQILVDRLAKEGIKVVQMTMESIPYEEKGSYYTEIVNNSAGQIIGSAIRLSGDKILFLEFSAGVTYGTPPGGHPLDSGKEYGIGTYPGQTHAESLYGWWYVDESGEKHHSYGNRAYMPMYHAEQAIILQIRTMAKEIFGA